MIARFGPFVPDLSSNQAKGTRQIVASADETACRRCAKAPSPQAPPHLMCSNRINARSVPSARHPFLFAFEFISPPLRTSLGVAFNLLTVLLRLLQSGLTLLLVAGIISLPLLPALLFVAMAFLPLSALLLLQRSLQGLGLAILLSQVSTLLAVLARPLRLRFTLASLIGRGRRHCIGSLLQLTLTRIQASASLIDTSLLQLPRAFSLATQSFVCFQTI